MEKLFKLDALQEILAVQRQARHHTVAPFRLPAIRVMHQGCGVGQVAMRGKMSLRP